MLERDYQSVLEAMISKAAWDIELPESWRDFVNNVGVTSSCEDDPRRAVRMRARARGMLFSDGALPCFPRSSDPIPVLSTDFSKSGAGFMAAEQFWPEEIVRVALPTFCIQVQVVRCRRLSEKCYSFGGVLLHKIDPSPSVFDVNQTDAELPAQLN